MEGVTPAQIAQAEQASSSRLRSRLSSGATAVGVSAAKSGTKGMESNGHGNIKGKEGSHAAGKRKAEPQQEPQPKQSKGRTFSPDKKAEHPPKASTSTGANKASTNTTTGKGSSGPPPASSASPTSSDAIANVPVKPTATTPLSPSESAAAAAGDGAGEEGEEGKTRPDLIRPLDAASNAGTISSRSAGLPSVLAVGSAAPSSDPAKES
jgi:hypothetical protein